MYIVGPYEGDISSWEYKKGVSRQFLERESVWKNQSWKTINQDNYNMKSLPLKG